jgi:hypothetical protein
MNHIPVPRSGKSGVYCCDFFWGGAYFFISFSFSIFFLTFYTTRTLWLPPFVLPFSLAAEARAPAPMVLAVQKRVLARTKCCLLALGVLQSAGAQFLRRPPDIPMALQNVTLLSGGSAEMNPNSTISKYFTSKNNNTHCCTRFVLFCFVLFCFVLFCCACQPRFFLGGAAFGVAPAIRR